jgi:hypothetical protein
MNRQMKRQMRKARGFMRTFDSFSLEEQKYIRKRLPEALSEALQLNEEQTTALCESFFLCEKRISKKEQRKIDKLVDQAMKDFKRTHVAIKKQKAAIAKTKSAGMYTSRLDPEGWITAIVNFIIYSMPAGGAGRTKKMLKKLLEHIMPDINHKQLFEIIDPHIDEFEELTEWPPVEMSEADDQLSYMMLGECEPLILQYADLMIQAEDPVYTGRMTVRKLNEEVKRLKNGGNKVARPDHEPTKNELFSISLDLISDLVEKLAEFGVTSPDKIKKFMLIMAEKVQFVMIKKKASVTVAKPVPKVIKESSLPNVVKIKHLIALAD